MVQCVYTVNTRDEFSNVSVTVQTLPSAGMHMPLVTYLRLTWLAHTDWLGVSTHALLLQPSNHIYLYT